MKNTIKTLFFTIFFIINKVDAQKINLSSSQVKGEKFYNKVKDIFEQESAESKKIFEMISQVHLNLQNSFDYKIKISEPKFNSNSRNNFDIKINIIIYGNANLEVCENYLLEKMREITLTKTEIDNYRKINKKVYEIKYNNENFYLRNESSKNDLIELFNFQHIREYYMSLYTVESEGKKLIDGLNFFDYESQEEYYPYIIPINSKFSRNYNKSVIIFPKYDKIVGQATRVLKLNINEIENISDFNIKPLTENLIEIKHGGIIVNEKNGHGLVTAISGYTDNENQPPYAIAQLFCENLALYGFSDWHLPTNEDVNKMAILDRFKLASSNSRNLITKDGSEWYLKFFRPIRRF